MPKGFSFINLLIVIGLIVFAVLGYQEYIKSNSLGQQKNGINKETPGNSLTKETTNTLDQKTSTSSTKTTSKNTNSQKTAPGSTYNQPKNPTNKLLRRHQPIPRLRHQPTRRLLRQ